MDRATRIRALQAAIVIASLVVGALGGDLVLPSRQPSLPVVCPACPCLPSMVAPETRDVPALPTDTAPAGTSLLEGLPLTPAAILMSVLPLGCSAVQVAKWQAFGASVANCLASKCELGADLVTGLQSGGWVDLLVSEVPCALGCLAGAIGTMEATPVEVARRTTWHGTAGSETRREPGWRVRIVPAR